MVVMPVLMLWMKLQVFLRERRHAPWIHKFLPTSACNLLLKGVVGYEVEAEQLVGAELHIRCAVSVEMVIDDDVSFVAIVTLEVSCHLFRCLSPSLHMFVVIHEFGKS